MAGLFSRWILSRVTRSALAFETESIETYRRLREQLGSEKSCGGPLHGGLCHLLEEEEQHWKILQDTADGKLSPDDLEKVLAGHLFGAMESIEPLAGEDLARWGAELSQALEQEEKTWIFYGNLRRMSKIPAVRKAFEVLAKMEKEHVDMLRRFLGRERA